MVNGQPLPVKEAARLWRYHKPEGLVVSHKDEKGRDTVFQHLPATMPRVVSIGRLDLNTEGLLLLTNDGGLARLLELPATGWVRRYRIRVYGRVDEAALKKLADGVSVDGIHYGPIEARLDKVQGANAWLSFALREGKNREVKKVCEHLGLTVNRLIRVAFGPFQLGELKRGEVEEVSPKVIAEQLGAGRPGAADTKGWAAKQKSTSEKHANSSAESLAAAPSSPGAGPRRGQRRNGCARRSSTSSNTASTILRSRVPASSTCSPDRGRWGLKPCRAAPGMCCSWKKPPRRAGRCAPMPRRWGLRA